MKRLICIALLLLSATPQGWSQTRTVGPRGQGIQLADRTPFLDALGGTVAGKALFRLSGPGSITYPRINANNTVTLVDAATLFGSAPDGVFTLSKLAQSGASSGQVPQWNGSAWVPAALNVAGLTTSNEFTNTNRWTGTSQYAGAISYGIGTTFAFDTGIASAFRTAAGLVIGTNVQAYDPDLTTYAGITPSANVQTLLGAADYTAFKASLALNNVNNTTDANKPISTATQTALNAKQDTLVSATNIKTVNGTSILGSGDITISGGGGGATDFLDVTVSPYTAAADGKRIDDGAITTGTNVLTSATANFAASGEVGKYIRIDGAGVTPTGTATVNGSGVVTGFNLTSAGSQRAYPPNSTFSVAVSGTYGSTPAVGIASVNSSGQVTGVALGAGGQAKPGDGYTPSSTPALIFPPAALITTIASRTSATQVTLTHTAGTTVTGRSFYYGTDNSATIQAAIDAAAGNSSKVKTVFIPPGPGIYLCSVTGKRGVNIRGGLGPNGQGPLYGNIASAVPDHTILMPVASTAPVIYYPNSTQNATGASVAQILFLGGRGDQSNSVSGTGIQVDSGTGFKLSQCEFNGFEIGLAASGWDNFVDTCEFNYCTTGVMLNGKNIALAYAVDGWTFANCGSNFTKDCFNSFGSKENVVQGGNYNNMERFCVLEGSGFIVTSANLEHPSVSGFDIIGQNPSLLHVGYVKGLISGGDSTILYRDSMRNATGSSANDIRIKSVQGFTRVQTIRSTIPEELPRGTIIERYSDDTWATKILTEWWDLISPTIFTKRTERAISDEFLFSYAGSGPYGPLAWKDTNIGATGYTAAYEPYNFLMVYGSDASATTCSARFNMTNHPINSTDYFELRWIFSADSYANARFRVGLASETASLDPTDFVGIRVDKSLGSPDGSLMFEIRQGGTVLNGGGAGQVVAPLPAGNGQTNQRELIITRNSTGFYCVIKATDGSVLGQEVFSSAAPSSAWLFPAIYTGVTSAVSQNVYCRRFKLRVFQQ